VYFAGLTDYEILGNAVAFMVAGFETTATTLQFFSYAMATNPDIQEMVGVSSMEPTMYRRWLADMLFFP